MTSTFCLILLFLVVTILCQGAAVCPDGFYGPGCSRRCRGHCSNNRCYLLPTGHAVTCREDCEKGWRGPACSIKCKYYCLECGRQDGQCIGPCRDGYYTPGCSKRCPGNCRKCNQDSGYCEHSCINGYYGDFCSLSCSCDRCDRETGRCLNPKTVKQTSPTTVLTSPRLTVTSVTSATIPKRIVLTKEASTREWQRGQDKDDTEEEEEKVEEDLSKPLPKHSKIKHKKGTIQPQGIVLVSLLSMGAVVTLISVSCLTLDRYVCTLCVRGDRSTVGQGGPVREQRPTGDEENHIYDDIGDSRETRLPESDYLNPVFEPSFGRHELPGYNTFSNRVRT